MEAVFKDGKVLYLDFWRVYVICGIFIRSKTITMLMEMQGRVPKADKAELKCVLRSSNDENTPTPSIFEQRIMRNKFHFIKSRIFPNITVRILMFFASIFDE